MHRNPLRYDRVQLWADLVARQLLADVAVRQTPPGTRLASRTECGKPDAIGGDAVERACDAAIKKMIGPIDRAQLIDAAKQRVVELAAQFRATDPPAANARSAAR